MTTDRKMTWNEVVAELVKVTVERDQLREDYNELKARFHTYNLIMADHAIHFKDMETATTRIEVLEGALRGIMEHLVMIIENSPHLEGELIERLENEILELTNVLQGEGGRNEADSKVCKL